jgi:hypothetical protein
MVLLVCKIFPFVFMIMEKTAKVQLNALFLEVVQIHLQQEIVQQKNLMLHANY